DPVKGRTRTLGGGRGFLKFFYFRAQGLELILQIVHYFTATTVLCALELIDQCASTDIKGLAAALDSPVAAKLAYRGVSSSGIICRSAGQRREAIELGLVLLDCERTAKNRSLLRRDQHKRNQQC